MDLNISTVMLSGGAIGSEAFFKMLWTRSTNDSSIQPRRYDMSTAMTWRLKILLISYQHEDDKHVIQTQEIDGNGILFQLQSLLHEDSGHSRILFLLPAKGIHNHEADHRRANISCISKDNFPMEKPRHPTYYRYWGDKL